MIERKQIDSVLRRSVDNGDVPGVVAVLADDSGPVYEAAWGERAAGSGQPMTADSVVWLASMTKAVTTVAAMQLVEQGRLTLDEPLQALVPQLGEIQVLEGFDDGGNARLRPPRAPITLRHLLTHTSGFSYDFFSDTMARYCQQQGIPGVASCLDAALGVPLLCDPGTRWEYGIGIDWAGKTVEAVTGQLLGDVLRERIFEPLGMRDTGFSIRPDMRDRLAKVHGRQPDGSLVATSMALPDEVEFQMGGGGLYGTAADYLAFAQMIMHGGSYRGAQILQPETVAMMSRNQIGDLDVMPLRSSMAALTHDADFFPGMPCKWGFGFLINTQPTPEGRAANSLAWAGLANTFYWVDPVQRVCGVFLTQILPFFDERAVGSFRRFEAAAYEALAAG